MAQKNASPTKEQAEVLEKNGLNKLTWVVLEDMNHYLVVKHRITGDVKHIKK